MGDNVSKSFDKIHGMKQGVLSQILYILYTDNLFEELKYSGLQIQNAFVKVQSTQIKSVISMPIKHFIHHYPRALFNDIPGLGRSLNDIPGSYSGFVISMVF